MKRGTRMLLGISIALITAASLHMTVGDRFHQRMPGRYGGFGCGHYWKDHHKDHHNRHAGPEKEPVENLSNNQ